MLLEPKSLDVVDRGALDILGLEHRDGVEELHYMLLRVLPEDQEISIAVADPELAHAVFHRRGFHATLAPSTRPFRFCQSASRSGG